jgi:UDP-N-acetyl-D-mannosaminuronate dehydrogenase
MGGHLKGERVGLLGLSYKGNVDDTRESPSWEVIHLLKEKGAHIEIFDPHVPGESTTKTFDDLLSKVKSLVLVTDHREFKAMDYHKLKNAGIKAVIDGRNCLDKEAIKKLGIRYHGIGRD